MRMSGPMRTAIMSFAICSPSRTPASNRSATMSVWLSADCEVPSLAAARVALAFADEVRRLDERVRPKQQADNRARAGTFGELVNAYRASPEFTGLAQRTKKDYQRILDYLKPLHDFDLSAFDVAQIW